MSSKPILGDWRSGFKIRFYQFIENHLKIQEYQCGQNRWGSVLSVPRTQKFRISNQVSKLALQKYNINTWNKQDLIVFSSLITIDNTL